MSNKAVTADFSWIVVEVHSGIPVRIKAFTDYETAEKYSETLRNNLNLENDETGIFQIDVGGH